MKPCASPGGLTTTWGPAATITVLVADPKRRLARLDHEHLGVGVPVELRPGAGLRMSADDGERNVTVLSADELV